MRKSSAVMLCIVLCFLSGSVWGASSLAANDVPAVYQLPSYDVPPGYEELQDFPSDLLLSAEGQETDAFRRWPSLFSSYTPVKIFLRKTAEGSQDKELIDVIWLAGQLEHVNKNTPQEVSERKKQGLATTDDQLVLRHIPPEAFAMICKEMVYRVTLCDKVLLEDLMLTQKVLYDLQLAFANNLPFFPNYRMIRLLRSEALLTYFVSEQVAKELGIVLNDIPIWVGRTHNTLSFFFPTQLASGNTLKSACLVLSYIHVNNQVFVIDRLISGPMGQVDPKEVAKDHASILESFNFSKIALVQEPHLSVTPPEQAHTQQTVSDVQQEETVAARKEPALAVKQEDEDEKDAVFDIIARLLMMAVFIWLLNGGVREIRNGYAVAKKRYQSISTRLKDGPDRVRERIMLGKEKSGVNKASSLGSDPVKPSHRQEKYHSNGNTRVYTGKAPGYMQKKPTDPK